MMWIHQAEGLERDCDKGWEAKRCIGAGRNSTLHLPDLNVYREVYMKFMHPHAETNQLNYGPFCWTIRY